MVRYTVYFVLVNKRWTQTNGNKQSCVLWDIVYFQILNRQNSYSYTQQQRQTDKRQIKYRYTTHIKRTQRKKKDQYKTAGYWLALVTYKPVLFMREKYHKMLIIVPGFIGSSFRHRQLAVIFISQLVILQLGAKPVHVVTKITGFSQCRRRLSVFTCFHGYRCWSYSSEVYLSIYGRQIWRALRADSVKCMYIKQDVIYSKRYCK